MNLQSSIQAVRELTGQLQEAFNQEDFQRCADLLPQRAEAMDRFEALHRAASAEDKAACESILMALARQDKELQAVACAGARLAHSEMREGFATLPNYPTEAATSCVDRKA